MIAIRRSSRRDTEDKFNRLVGNRIGRPTGRTRRVRYNAQVGDTNQIRRIARGAPGVPKAITKAFRSTSGAPAGGGSGYTSETLPSIRQSIFDKLVQDYTGTLAEQRGIDAAATEREASFSEDRPWYQDVTHALWGSGDEGEQGGLRGSIVGRAMDIASRPAYAVAESMQSMAEASKPGLPWMTNPNFYIKEAIPGFIRGLTGEDKTGFGQVYESTKNNPYSFSVAGENPLAKLEEAHPAIEQGLAIGTGALGEIALDPTNVIMGGLPHVVRETGDVATDAVLRNLHTRNASTLAEDFAVNSPLIGANPLYARDPALFGKRIASAIEQNLDDAVVDVLGGGNRGTRLLNNRTFPSVVANSTVQHIKEAITAPLRQSVNTLWNRASSGRMTAAGVDGLRRQYTDFDEFWKLLEADAIAKKLVPPTSTTDDVLDAIMTGGIKRNTVNKFMDDVIRKYDSELQPYFNRALGEAQNMTYRTLGVRLGSKVVPFKAPGKAYSWVGSKLNNHFPNATNRTFAGVFPGRLGLATGRARALGFKGYDEFTTMIEDFAKKHKFTADEGIELAEKLARGGRFGDSRKDDALDWLRDMYNRIYDEEVAVGARPSVKPGGKPGVGAWRDPNYSYIYLRGGLKGKRNQFILDRKGALNKQNVLGAGAYDIDEARKLGLKPVDNAFDNLRYRYLKSTRDRTRAHFLNDMVHNYSLFNGKPVRRLKPGDLRRRGLTEVGYSKLDENLRAMVDLDPGSKFYIPKEFDEVVQKFNELSGWSSANGGQLMRNWGKVINTLKAYQTLPFTGFHSRNAIGDILMGLMDNINPRAYKWVSEKFVLNKVGKRAVFDFVPGISHSYDEMWEMYRRNADSGFIATEFGSYSSLTGGRIPRRIGRKTANTVRNLSDKRELVPRFTHFVEAYRQEAQALWNTGVRNLDTIAKKAEDAALFRVNSYKFDYAALLTGEKVLKSLAFPFYTYMRKAAPLLIQQMYTNPHYLSLLSRTMQYNDESSAGEVHKRNFPQLVRDLGFATLTGGEEPTIMRMNFLPTDALSLLTSIQSLNPNELTDKKLWSDILSDLNPLAQVPFELASGRTIFGNKPLPENKLDYLFNKVPVLGEFQQEIADIPGLPGGSEHSMLDRLTGNVEEGEGKPLLQSLISERLLGLGIPIEKVTEEQQSYQQQANRDLYVEAPIKAFNDSNDLYSITVNEDMTYNVNNKITGQRMAESVPSLEQTLDFARGLPNSNWQENRVPTVHPPDQQDVNRVLGIP